jgi:hypothetical protein
MATWWTITIPPTFKDVSADAATQAAFKGQVDKVRQAGGDLDFHIYSSDGPDVLIVLDSTFGDMPQKVSVLEGFESGARKTSYGTGKELDYTTSRTDTFIVGKQHAMATGNVEAWYQRWTGAGTDGKLHSLGVACIGPEATCKGTLASVAVESASFKKLAALSTDPEHDSAYAIGYAVGGGLVVLLLLGALVKARSRARA